MWMQKTLQPDLSVYNCRVCGELECGCKRHDNQTFLFLIIESMERRNVDAKGHSTGRPELSRVKRGSSRRCSSKGRERAIVSHMNIGTVSKATLGKHSRDGVERIRTFPNA